jgi:nitroreductase
VAARPVTQNAVSGATDMQDLSYPPTSGANRRTIDMSPWTPVAEVGLGIFGVSQTPHLPGGLRTQTCFSGHEKSGSGRSQDPHVVPAQDIPRPRKQSGVTDTGRNLTMDTEALTHPTDPEIAAHALAEAAAAAGYAPSIHNTQPWRWRLTADTLELRLVRGRILPVTDPDSRLATLSCGVALHHARIALAAQGWHATVTRMPSGGDRELLARLHVEGRTPVDSASALHLRTVPLRHTDRRPVTDVPVDPAGLAAVTTAVQAQDTGLHTLRPGQLLELAAAADHAQRSEAADPAWRAELAYWTGPARPSGSGIADAAIPDRAPQTTVPGRDFGHHGELPISAAHDREAVFVVLYGDTDEPVSWLRAGEALSAGWLTATEHGISVLPHSSPIEVIATRQAIRAMIASIGHPFLVLRLGTADPADMAASQMSRLPAEQIIDRL